MVKMRGWGKHADAFLAASIIGLMLLLIIPLPAFLLDVLLCLSIVFAVMTLLLTLYVENPLEFSAFPTLLLFLTLFRLGLNIASTRMILTHGEAGDIIQTFGNVVIQGNFLVGLVLFALLTIINFVVVTKGAGRIAEVSARFTLEALPGKQMSIENDLSSGLISLQEAKLAREKMRGEADFYGAMDGASKFVRGDAIAGVVMTLINLVGGFCMGVGMRKMSWTECLGIFSRLTIGDGLVTQIPGLLVSIGAGIIVTRASSGSIGKILPKQIFTHPKVLLLAGGTLLALSLVPGMPLLITAPMAMILLGFGYRLARKQRVTKAVSPVSDPNLETAIVYPLEVQLGVGLVEMAEKLVQKAVEMRREILVRWGIRIPSLHVSDQKELSHKGFLIKLRGLTAYSGRADSFETLSHHLLEIIESQLHELINRQEVARMIELAKKEDPSVVEELLPEKIKIGQILRILQSLLREKIPVRDFVTILGLIADHLPSKGELDLEQLTEKIRLGLSRGISEHFFGEKKTAYAITLDPKIEQTLQVALQKGGSLLLRPATAQKIQESLSQLLKKTSPSSIKPVVITHPNARLALRQLLEKEWPSLPVLSYGEISKEVHIQSLGTISSEVLAG